MNNYKTQWLRSGIFAILASLSLGAVAAPPSDSPYARDTQTTFNSDSTQRAFRLASIVTCVIRDMTPEAFADQGRYVAWIDSQKCEGDTGAAPTLDQDTSQLSKQFSRALVESRIDPATDKLLVGVLLKWQTLDDGQWQMEHIRVRVDITSGPAITPPYGTWTMDFCSSVPGSEGTCGNGRGLVRMAGSNVTVMQGNAGSTEFAGGRATFSDPKTGSGLVVSGRSGSEPLIRRFSVEDGRYLLETGADSQSCLDPRITNPNTKFSVWENMLYDTSNGQRLEYGNMGFPIRLPSDPGRTIGYVSYWGAGIWNEFKDPANVGNLDRYFLVDEKPLVAFINGSDQNVTLQIPGGRLSKSSKVTSSVSEIQGVPLNLGVSYKSGSMRDYIVNVLSKSVAEPSTYGFNLTGSYEGDGNFRFTGYQACGGALGCTRNLFNSPVTRTLTQLVSEAWNIGGWVDGTGSGFNISLQDVDLSSPNQLVVVRNIEEIKPPGSGTMPTNLICLRNCPTQSDDGVVTFSPGVSGPVEFTWSDTQRAPVFKGTAVALRSNSTTESYYLQLFEGSVVDGKVQSLLCDSSDVIYCEWSKANITFSWSTGLNAREFAYVTAGNQTIQPGRPVLLSYTVPAEGLLPVGVNPSFAGKTMVLQSPGPGQIWFPGYCINQDTGERQAICGQDSEWINDLYIPTSTTAAGTVTLLDSITGQAVNPARQYHVKWLRRGAFFALHDNPNICSGMTLPEAGASVPTFAEWRNPSSELPWDAPDSEFEVAPSVVEGQRQ